MHWFGKVSVLLGWLGLGWVELVGWLPGWLVGRLQIRGCRAPRCFNAFKTNKEMVGFHSKIVFFVRKL